MPTVDYRWTPHLRQAHVFVDPARIKCAITGARAGKTNVGVAWAAHRATRMLGYDARHYRSRAPFVGAVGAPTFRMLTRIIVPEFRRQIPKGLIVKDRADTSGELILRGAWGDSIIRFLTGRDVTAWYGQELFWVWLDEAPVIREELFDEAQTRLSTTRGPMLLTGTPQGPNWVYHRIFKPWREGAEDISFHTWRTIDNPYIDREYIESQRRTMPARYFRRTFEASWETFEGQVFEEYSPEIHDVRSADVLFVLPDGRRVIGGAQGERVFLRRVWAGQDWGHAHRGALVIVGIDSRDRLWVLDESSAAGLLVDGDGDTWVNRARRLCDRWQVYRAFCGQDRPENIRVYGRAGIPARKADNAVHDGIQSVAQALYPGPDGPRMRFVADRCPELTAALARYHWKEGSREEPAKVDDDEVDALRYAVHTELKRRKYGHQRIPGGAA